MKTILDSILSIRGEAPLKFDKTNKNRYCVVVPEEDGSRTAYYSTAPLYREDDRSAVDMRFHKEEAGITCFGSNATVSVTDSLRIENRMGALEMRLPAPALFGKDGELLCGSLTLWPTTNGVMIEAASGKDRETVLTLKVDAPYGDIRENGRYAALMCERFKPFLVASCLGTVDAEGDVIAPATLSLTRTGEGQFRLVLCPAERGRAVRLEINLYEPKLFQDTTVESNSPNTNNVFGTIGFLGTTPEFGEQWLYTKPDYSKFPEIEERVIRSAVLHIPTYGGGVSEIRAYGVEFRFCSFGSTWNKKVPEAQKFSSSKHCNDYFSVDLTPIFCNSHGRLLKNNGLILRTIQGTHGFTAIATADSCLQPQILEINYI